MSLTDKTPIQTVVAIKADFADSAPKHENPKRKRIAPISIRVTHEERAWLMKASGNMSVNAYIKQCVFHANDNAPSKAKKLTKSEERQLLARILGKLARLEIFTTIKGLFRAMEKGHMRLKPETEAALQQACADIADMRRMLMAALGIKPE